MCDRSEPVTFIAPKRGVPNPPSAGTASVFRPLPKQNSDFPTIPGRFWDAFNLRFGKLTGYGSVWINAMSTMFSFGKSLFTSRGLYFGCTESRSDGLYASDGAFKFPRPTTVAGPGTNRQVRRELPLIASFGVKCGHF